MSITPLPLPESHMHKWVKAYSYRYERYGPANAAKYLRQFVPIQLQEQVVKTSEQLLAKRKRRT